MGLGLGTSPRDELRHGQLKFHTDKWIYNDVDRLISGLLFYNSRSEPNGTHMKLAADVVRFHEANGSMTESVYSATRSPGGVPVIDIAHQPNTFAALNVVGLTIVAEAVRLRTTSAATSYRDVRALFRMIDYDVAGDQRFRGAMLPDYNRRSPFVLAGAVPKSMHRKIAWSVPTPSVKTVNQWLESFRSAVSNSRTAFERVGLPVVKPKECAELCQTVSVIIQEAYAGCRTLTTANGQILSRLVNNVWNLNTLFVEGSSILRYSNTADDARNLSCTTEPPELSTGFRMGAFRVCDGCSERLPAELSREPSFDDMWEGSVGVSASAHCGRCDRTYREPFDLSTGNFVPDVGLCDALDEGLEFAGEIAYAGGVTHMARARAAQLHHRDFNGIGYKKPAFAWEPKGVLVTKGSEHERRLVETIGPELTDMFQSGRLPAALYTCLVPNGDLPGAMLEGLMTHKRFQPAHVGPIFSVT